ncbi:MAG: bifunctional pyr operon transcriptional regulator/uracil phosphoribosyltransferase PyrR [Akkermansiaceae bacterium]|jgi:pyrimidine operon attenuation protein/uracil phosphoribosyltransferase|nr:bifunctional pyr operon transcriptional regulator/uracil phosphoribosyltransferase PyrR [Akkermansiaceae bacterium]
MNRTLDAEAIEAGIQELARQIRATLGDEPIALVGIRSRGDEVAERLCRVLSEDDPDLMLGVLDISLYRDDYEHLHENPQLQGSEIDFEIEATRIVLVDDVLFTGRTIRAALDALCDYGRPGRIELAVLIDRGHREMPIQADFVGIRLETSRHDHVYVSLEGTDGEDKIEIKPA